MKVITISHKYFLWIFWEVLVSLICDIKIDVIMCVNLIVSSYFFSTALLFKLGNIFV